MYSIVVLQYEPSNHLESNYFTSDGNNRLKFKN